MIAGLVLAIIAVVLVAWQQPWRGSSTPAKTVVPAFSSASANAIAAQIQGLSDATSRAAFLAAAGDSAAGRAWATQTYDNITALGATGISMRFITGGDSGTVAAGSTQAKVAVSWRPGPASGLVQVETQESMVTFALDRLKGQTFAVRDVQRDSGVVPLWLAGKLDVVRSPGATVISIDGGNASQPIADESDKAHAAVSKVVTSATERLVVVSPHTQSQAAELVDQTTDQIAQIAAVTTTLDGSDSPKAATMILLNPMVFNTMDARAAQVVMSHEATHMMTNAVTSNLETWVSEGFADYVALHDDKAPLSVSAGQILRSVKLGGAPAHLPTTSEFGSTQHGLGATYESAWMIYRMLGATYGDPAVLMFYNAALHGETTAKAAKTAFGLSIADITNEWRHYLVAKSASITS